MAQKMLDMFKRPDDPPEYYNYYMAPTALAVGGYGALKSGLISPEGLNSDGLDMAASQLAGLLCIGGIAGLSSQSTARLGSFR